MKRKILGLVTSLGMMAGICYGQKDTKELIINLKDIKTTVQPAMWGVFFEDINMGADGGLYAEMIKNRSFEFSKPFMGWQVTTKKEGDILVLNRQNNTANPRFIRVAANHPGTAELSLTNEGFRGMGIRKELRYDFSLMYRQQKKGLLLHLELLAADGKNIGGAILSPQENDGKWHKQAISFNATATEAKASFKIWFEGEGAIDLDMISLFPSNTWKSRPGGLRADMVQMLADMKPGFLRFPGGCIVEGFDLSQRYQWKKTIGPIEERELLISRWNFEFGHRPAPDYYQTFGLGFFEYFQLAEDLGAEPLPILNCGMACQFNTAEVVPMNELQHYIQDALDLIEFANGAITTPWGKRRAELGHPEPFQLKMLGIGNENWGPQYIERLDVFTKAIKQKYPGIKLVNSAGTDPAGERFEYLDSALRKQNADLIDEHYYRSPAWFLQNASRYDHYPRNGSKVFAGEYAAQSDRIASPHNVNNLETALAEAAFMTGLERNADVVNMASYAPLFAHADGWQWTPDLIWTNNLDVIGTPNYYVQQLFSRYKGDKVLNLKSENNILAGQDSLYASAVLDEVNNELIIKIINVSSKTKQLNLKVSGGKKPLINGKQIVLGGKPDNKNSFEEPGLIAPHESPLPIKGNNVPIEAAPSAFTVIRISTGS